LEGFLRGFGALKSSYLLHFQQLIGRKVKLFILNNSSASDILSFYSPFVFNNPSGSTFILTFSWRQASRSIFTDKLATRHAFCRRDFSLRVISAAPDAALPVFPPSDFSFRSFLVTGPFGVRKLAGRRFSRLWVSEFTAPPLSTL
jgi:hypothetical protein